MQSSSHEGRLKIEVDKKQCGRWALAGFIIGTSIVFWALVVMFLFQKGSSKTPFIGDTIVAELEQYKISNGCYPDTLDKVNMKEHDVFYEYIGPDRYTLGVSEGYLSARYHSASKKWSEVGSPKDKSDSASDLQYQKLLLNSVNSTQ